MFVRSFVAFVVCSVVPPYSQFFLPFTGINLLLIIKFNQLKAMLKHCEEVPSCFNTYGGHATEKDFFLRSDTNI